MKLPFVAFCLYSYCDISTWKGGPQFANWSSQERPHQQRFCIHLFRAIQAKVVIWQFWLETRCVLRNHKINDCAHKMRHYWTWCNFLFIVHDFLLFQVMDMTQWPSKLIRLCFSCLCINPVINGLRPSQRMSSKDPK